MKLLIASLFLICISSCRKQSVTDPPSASPIAELVTALKDSLPANMLTAVNYDTAFLSREGDAFFARFAFRGSSLTEKFVLLKLSDGGDIESGRIVAFTAGDLLNGMVSITNLDGQPHFDSLVMINGFIQRPSIVSPGNKATLQPGEGKVLPEVIVISQRTKPTTYTYYRLAAFLGSGAGSPSTSSAYYSSAAGGSSSGNPAGGAYNPSEGKGKANTGTNGKEVEVILVDFEMAQENPAIDIEKYLKCFASVPDNGAVCTIELMADLPVDNHPEDFFNWNTGSPGHTFIRLHKAGSGTSVLQSIGFYPVSGWKTFTTPAPITGKFVDNGGHEFNASIKMTVSAAQFQSILLEMIRSRNNRYDIDEYNCTDWALQIFNHARTTKLEIPKFDLPGGQAPFGSQTPQGIYQKIVSFKNDNVEKSNISLPAVKGYVANSKGPCN